MVYRSLFAKWAIQNNSYVLAAKILKIEKKEMNQLELILTHSL